MSAIPTFATSNVGITHITRLTATDHGAQGQGIHHLADGIGTARMSYRARVLALAAEAGQFARTLRVHGATLRLGRYQVASYGWVATESGRAAALSTVVVHTALGADAAVARILTPFVAAGQVEGALVIRAALGTVAAHQRIAAVSVQAVAPSTVIEVRPTDGSSSALRKSARIDTLLVNTGFRSGALSVGSASEEIAVLQGISGVSLVADAQRAMQLDVATGLGGAEIRLLAGIAAHLVDAGLVVGAVAVADALRLRGLDLLHLAQTLGVWRAVEVWWAAADGLVVDGTTDGIDAAGVQAWISALLANARPVPGAVFVDHTLRIAAGGSSVVDATDSVAAARRWLARIHRLRLARSLALDEWIAHHVGRTAAHRTVVDGLANGSESAFAHAGVHALGVDAGPILGTVRAQGTLRSAALDQRISEESWQAFAHRLLVLLSAYGVGAAGRGVARIRWRRWSQKTLALDKSIAGISSWAGADGDVVVGAANSLQSADSGAWVLALVADAGLVGRTFGVANTLRTAALVGIADVFRLAALAHIVLSLDAAHGIGAAGRRIAGILGCWRRSGQIWKSRKDKKH